MNPSLSPKSDYVINGWYLAESFQVIRSRGRLKRWNQCKTETNFSASSAAAQLFCSALRFFHVQCYCLCHLNWINSRMKFCYSNFWHKCCQHYTLFSKSYVRIIFGLLTATSPFDTRLSSNSTKVEKRISIWVSIISYRFIFSEPWMLSPRAWILTFKNSQFP